VKAKITKIILLLSVVVLSGCLSMNPERAQRTISHWIPPGTPQEDATRIMKRHGFDCGPDDGRAEGSTVYWFSRENKVTKNFWWFYVHFKNGKVDSIERLGTGNDLFGPHLIPSGG
jgi:hypothetical protein